MPEFIHGELTRQVIGAAFEVWKVLGYGFLEKVYENSLAEEFKRSGIVFQQQFAIDVMYKSVLVGAYIADLFVDRKVIVEIKTEKEYNAKHEAQLLNYLKATGIRVGLLLNFGEKRCEHKRLII
ncbi:MAG: GxxExxY protein [Chloroflexi bacterium]|nr:GxxExxY protein [Chloroflexota bacterium]